jgi:ATP-dependent Clp protease ATP-binding subunit ClpA
MPFTPRSKKVLELGLRECKSLGHTHIETLHLLLGLIREHEGVGARILRDANLDSARIRDTAIAMIPAGETVSTGGHTPTVRRVQALHASGVPGATFTVAPNQALVRLLMAAAGRALGDGRHEFGVEDVRAVIDEEPPSSEAASA